MEWERAIGKPPQWPWGLLCCTQWDNTTGHCCLATGQRLPSNSCDRDQQMLPETHGKWILNYFSTCVCLFVIPFHIADEKANGISVYRVGLCFNLLQNRYCSFSMWHFCVLQSGPMFLMQICYLILCERYTFTIFLMRKQSLLLLLSWPLLINPSNSWFKKFRTV